MPGVIFNLSYSLFTTIIFLQIQSNFLYKLQEKVSKYSLPARMKNKALKGVTQAKLHSSIKACHKNLSKNNKQLFYRNHF